MNPAFIDFSQLDPLSSALLLLIITLLFLVGVLVNFCRKLRHTQLQQQLEFQHLKQSSKQLIQTLEESKAELLTNSRTQITSLFKQMPSLSEQLGNKGIEQLEKYLSWQDREIKRQQEEFSQLVNNKTNQVLNNFDELIHKAVTQIQTRFDTLLDNQEKIIVEAIKLSTQETSQKIKQEQEKRANEIISKSNQLISQISKEVIGKSLNREEQQDFVIKSLEKAWEKGLIHEDKK